MTILVPDPAPCAEWGSTGSGDACGVTLAWGSASRRGAARAGNQDAYLASPPVFAVADGMGGHAAGDQASSCVVDALGPLVAGDDVTKAAIAECLRAARNAIGRIQFADGAPPGSTLTGVVVTRHRGRPCWMVVNVGDSRCYRWDGRALTRLTDDHNVATELQQHGAPVSTSARFSRIGHVLTRAVVAEPAHDPDVWLIPVERGDRMLVCSDGVHGPLTDETIGGVLRAVREPCDAATALVDRVTAAGGRDDATAVVVDAG